MGRYAHVVLLLLLVLLLADDVNLAKDKNQLQHHQITHIILAGVMLEKCYPKVNTIGTFPGKEKKIVCMFSSRIHSLYSGVQIQRITFHR